MSGFKIRGFIEGFYGRVWSDEKRREVLQSVAAHGMNSYFYAPKDDPFLRRQWRSEYDGESLRRFSSLFSFTKDLGLSLYYCLSPGLDAEYSSDADFAALMNKFNSLYSIGVRCFGLFLDDISDKLIHGNDKKRFSGVAQAHAYFINRVFSALPGGACLVVCPMQYNGSGEEEYITSLCRAVPDGVKVFWTGKKICSPELTSADAIKFINSTGKKPLYWDNYPVNDAEMYGEMHVGPYLNRAPDLADYCEGIVCNVMEYPLCSQISLLTVCDFLSDPHSYDPEKSFKTAVETVTGDSYDLWMPFFDHTRFSCLCDRFSVYLSDTLADIGSALASGDTNTAAEQLRDLISLYRTTSQTIHNNRRLSPELRPWLSRFDEITAILTLSLNYILSSANHPLALADETDTIINDSDTIRLSLRDAMIKYNLNAYKLAGFGLREFVETLISEFTV